MKEVLSVRIDKEVLDIISDLQKVRRWTYKVHESKADIITKCICNGLETMLPLPEGSQIIRSGANEPEMVIYDEETRLLIDRINGFAQAWEEIIYNFDDEDE